MQTFLPYQNFTQTARSLDRARLGKQRVEAKQIILALTGQSKGWTHHPITLKWEGFIPCLAYYGICMCKEWKRRGYKDSCLPFFKKYYNKNFKIPEWVTDKETHKQYKQLLISKNPEYYHDIFKVINNY